MTQWRDIARYWKSVSVAAVVDSPLTVVPNRVQIADEHGRLRT